MRKFRAKADAQNVGSFAMALKLAQEVATEVRRLVQVDDPDDDGGATITILQTVPGPPAATQYKLKWQG